jgi:sn-1 stearoyl-lipid 9-desaturase
MTRDHDDPYAVHSIVETPGASPVEGNVKWDTAHSLWNGAMMLATLILGPMTFRWSAFAVFILLTGGFLLLGHSVGFHRRLIHGSFKAPRWLDYLLMWCGTAVGMSGPFWMIRAHDLRDWAQRRPDCHAYLAHKRPMLIDGVWQLHFRLELANPPTFDLGEVGRDPFYRFLERSWMLQQLPIAALLYLLGGWPFVVWGVCARVFISVFGHWFVGHLAHNRGPQTWLVHGAGVQAFDVPWAAIPTMGEAWHNNHHAFPGSAFTDFRWWQVDASGLLIRLLARLGWAWDVRSPSPEAIAARARG